MNQTNIQSVLFPLDKFNLKLAKAWLSQHNFTFKKVHKTKNFYRVRQHEPIKGKKYYNRKTSI